MLAASQQCGVTQSLALADSFVAATCCYMLASVTRK